MIGQAPWRPRCCHSCGEPLENWSHPLQPDDYVPCPACARLYVVDSDTGELVWCFLGLEPLELQHMFDDLVAAYWRSHHHPAASAAIPERRAA